MRTFRLAFFIFTTALVSLAQAKTIHWLTFIDTTDENVGVIDVNTRKILYARWINLVNAALKEQGYDINPIDVYGNMTSPENCKNIINRLNCQSDDIVMFYYVGHGTENSRVSKYPLMLMAQTDVQKFIPLSWVHNTLKSKGARLTITIGMCCNARQGAPGRIAPSFSANYGNAYIGQNMSECIKKMFLNYKGDLLVTSASPSESSWACGSNVGPTDYFTLSLLAQFNNYLPDKSNPDWESMLRDMKEFVYEGVRTDPDIQRRYPGSTQTPIWENNLTAVSRPPVTKPTPPSVDVTNESDVTIMKTQLDKVLAYISSSNVEESLRFAEKEKFKKLFSPDVTVRIMSQDGNVVIDRESVGVFLDRISTSRLLMNVSAVDYSVDDDGKIKSLRVREVYKQQ